MKKKILIVAHKFLPQIDDDLVVFLADKKFNITHITHSFPDAKDRISSFINYSNGNKIVNKKSVDYKFLPEVLIFLKELIYTLFWSVLILKKVDVYIGMDGLCGAFGLILKHLGFCKKIVYWSIDFVPFNRFDNNWKNFIYHKINIFVCKHADEVWDLSPRMLEGRKKYFNLDRSLYKKHKIIQNGMWLDRINPVRYSDCDKKTMVFMGHLMKKQGVQNIIKQIPKIIKLVPGFKFKIIGEGNYKSELKNLAKQLSVQKYCIFLGRLSNLDLEKEIAKSSVAIAPYLVIKESYTYYADPGKVKTYLACGIPVLLTDLSWNAKEIEKNKCGLIILENGSDLLVKLKYIMNPKVNKKFRINALSYSKNYDYERIFKKLNL